MSIGQLTGWDANEIAEAAHDSVKMFINHHAEIRRIADTLCNGSLYQAWADIIGRGILELEKICEMDEDVCKNETKEVVTIKPLKEVWRE